ncbi:hypothetical protein CsSME_00032965 [Camellia sinensis var. sinensis]
MGKHLWTEDADEQIANNQPGCVRGVLHALGYHHWHYNVKKLLPHKKHNGPRHVKGKQYEFAPCFLLLGDYG